MDGGGVWEGMVVSFSFFFYSFFPFLSCPDEGHVGVWVEGIREEAGVEGMVVEVVVEEVGGAESDSAITSR